MLFLTFPLVSYVASDRLHGLSGSSSHKTAPPSVVAFHTEKPLPWLQLLKDDSVLWALIYLLPLLNTQL